MGLTTLADTGWEGVGSPGGDADEFLEVFLWESLV